MIKNLDRKILKYLGDHPHSHIEQIAEEIDKNRNTVVYRLKKLLNSGYVTYESRGTKKTYTINTPAELKKIEKKKIREIESDINQLIQESSTSPILDHSDQKPKLVIANFIDILPKYKNRIEENFQVTDYSDGKLLLEDDELIYRARDAEILVNNWSGNITASIIKQLPNLKYLHATTHMYQYIDTESLRNKNIHFSHVSDFTYKSTALSEYALAQTFALLRQVNKAGEQARNGVVEYKSFMGEQLKGKVAAIIGAEDTSRDLAQILRNLGVEVMIYSDQQEKNANNWGLEKFSTMEEIRERTDLLYFVWRRTAKSKANDKLNHKLLEGFSKNIYVISLTKHAFIDYEAIRKMLYAGKLRGVALDFTFENKANNQNTLGNINSIIHLPNVIISPDIAWYTKDSVENMNRITLDHLLAYESGSNEYLLF